MTMYHRVRRLDSPVVGRVAVSFDLDSTLADTRQRQWMVAKIRNKEGLTWTDYSMECADDEPLRGAVILARILYARGVSILINTGRSVLAEQLTVDWLDTQMVPFDALAMRPINARESNTKIKIRHIREFEEHTNYRVALHVEDWAEVAEEIESVLDLPCLTVAGKFLTSEPTAVASSIEKG